MLLKHKIMLPGLELSVFSSLIFPWKGIDIVSTSWLDFTLVTGALISITYLVLVSVRGNRIKEKRIYSFDERRKKFEYIYIFFLLAAHEDRITIRVIKFQIRFCCLSFGFRREKGEKEQSRWKTRYIRHVERILIWV